MHFWYLFLFRSFRVPFGQGHPIGHWQFMRCRALAKSLKKKNNKLGGIFLIALEKLLRNGQTDKRTNKQMDERMSV